MMRELLNEFSGEEVKSTGNGFLMVFRASAKAVECGSMAMRETPELGLAFGSGIHTGDVEVLPDDVVGVSVHTAARITAIARPLEVLVSSPVAWIGSLALIVSSVALFVRRMRDTGRYGWFWFLGLIPVVGSILLLVFWLPR